MKRTFPDEPSTQTRRAIAPAPPRRPAPRPSASPERRKRPSFADIDVVTADLQHDPRFESD